MNSLKFIRGVGMRKVLSVLGVFVIVTFATGSRCNEVTGPVTAPAPTPTPSPSSNSTMKPVVRSVEPDPYNEHGWFINGYNFAPSPSATLESDGSAIRRFVARNLLCRQLWVTVPTSTAPGPYTPCVTTSHGKGCGEFLVTVP